MDGRRVALVVGIDEYPGARLHGCVNDAKDIAEALSLEQYDFDVEMLTDAQATRRNILSRLDGMATGAGEFFLFFFAGHGTIHRNGGHLVSADGVDSDPGLALVELAQIAADASQRYTHMALIIDACHSGTGSTWVDQRPLSASRVEQEISSINESQVLLAACRPEQQSIEVGTNSNGHGIFSNALVEGMLHTAVDFDGNVTMHSLYDATSRALRRDDQTPVFKGDIAGTVILGRGFPPRTGQPIDPLLKDEVVAKSSRLINEYQALQTVELSDLAHRKNVGLKNCCSKLSEIARWHSETERQLPDVRRDENWTRSRHSLVNYMSTVAQVSIEDNLPVGRVQLRIGGGGFGQVWEITDGNSEYAYKVFHGGDLSDPIKPQRFRNGYYSMRKLDHPRIVRVHDLTEAPLGFTMHRVGGVDLRDTHVDRTDAKLLLDIAEEIADTVRFAHGAGVIHRDIKPENVIWGWDSKEERMAPFLTDFDLAYIETNQTVTVAQVGGVVHYAAPEQFYNSGSEAARSATVDVYAIAQLIYYLFVGQDPRAERPEANRQIFAQTVSQLLAEEAAEALINLYKSSSDPDPQKRPQSMDIVSGTLQRAKIDHLNSQNSGQLKPETVCQRVAFAYRGASEYEVSAEGIHMSSRANTLSISLHPRGYAAAGSVDFCFTINANDRFGMPGAKSGAKARQKFNQRIDRKLRRFKNATRSPGNHGYFETYINVSTVTLDKEGVSLLSEVLSAVIGALEEVD